VLVHRLVLAKEQPLKYNMKLYEKNRELESKLYMTERELDILKGAVK
jgi:hypothetical protein